MAPDEFFNTRNGKTNATILDGEEKKNVQLSLQGFELPMRHMASQRLAHCATCTAVKVIPQK